MIDPDLDLTDPYRDTDTDRNPTASGAGRKVPPSS